MADETNVNTEQNNALSAGQEQQQSDLLQLTQDELTTKLTKEKRTGENAILNQLKLKKEELPTFLEKFNAFKTAQENQETVAQKYERLSGEHTDLSKKYASTQSELTHLKASQQTIKAGIKPEFSDFVASEAMKLTSDTIDFETALNSYKTKNPQFSAETTVVKKKTSLNLTGGETKIENSNATMNNLIRGVKD